MATALKLMSSVNSDTAIETGASIKLHFSLALPDGAIIDSNFDKSPASFKLGDGSMLPGFEKVLMGLKPGEEISERIPAAEAFGMPNPQNQQRFAIDKFRHLLEDDSIPTEPGSVVSFRDPGGFDLPGVVVGIDEQTVEIDFNHPLAGKDIIFRALILSVLAPDEQAVELRL